MIIAIVLAIPIRAKLDFGDEQKDLKLDERDIMFSRAELVPETDRFEEYYKLNPGKKEADDRFRSKAGLLKEGSQKFDLLKFNSADANFEAVESFVYLRNKESLPTNKKDNEPEKLSQHIKRWLLQIGVVSVGITELKEHHIYKIKGRGKDYGKPIYLNHHSAIVFTVEMDKNMIDKAPEAETVMESSQQYFHSASIAAQLTLFIRQLGYSARPHFDGNYDILCTTLARDAGLGEIGRMGLLMTHEIGPRVRIAAVTTDIPIKYDQRNERASMLDFCKICKKCAENCPTKAISFEDMKLSNGVKRWTINHEACFTYWNIIGTDCAKCIKVCPYSHPSNMMHNFIRSGIHNSKLFARFALKADDLFYGRKH